MVRPVTVWILAVVLFWSMSGGLVASADTVALDQESQAQANDEKPSLIEAYPLLIVVFVLACIIRS